MRASKNLKESFLLVFLLECKKAKGPFICSFFCSQNNFELRCCFLRTEVEFEIWMLSSNYLVVARSYRYSDSLDAIEI